MFPRAEIEHLYATFGRYTAAGMVHCPCGCVPEEDVLLLASKPLRELAEADGLSSYHGKAIFTWGEAEHYRHFLPRFLELYSQNRRGALVDLNDVYQRLEHAHWREWDAAELVAIERYVRADWTDFANCVDACLTDRLLEHYLNYCSLEDLLSRWEIEKHEPALKNFVSFWYHHGSQVSSGGLRLNGTKYKAELLELLNRPGLTQGLEAAFFRNEGRDAEYAGRASVVLQMVEQAKALPPPPGSPGRLPIPAQGVITR